MTEEKLYNCAKSYYLLLCHDVKRRDSKLALDYLDLLIKEHGTEVAKEITRIAHLIILDNGQECGN